MDIVDLLKDSYGFLGDPLHRKAWEEIERLRARLQDIADFPLHGDYSNAYEMSKIAARALAGEVRENERHS